MTRYESNENFYLNEKGVRKYMIYYNSFSDMNVDYTKYNKENEKVAIQSFDEIYTELDSMFEGLPIVVYPCIVIILFISILFYFQTKKIELSYSKSNLCVYMYNGYSLKEVLKGYLKYQLIESIKLLASAFAAALVTAVVFNGCNSKFEFLEYQVFTYNGTILVLLFLFVFICTILMTLSLLHTINVHGWYEILKERRDLI